VLNDLSLCHRHSPRGFQCLNGNEGLKTIFKGSAAKQGPVTNTYVHTQINADLALILITSRKPDLSDLDEDPSKSDHIDYVKGSSISVRSERY
jgi:hypothetical protein